MLLQLPQVPVAFCAKKQRPPLSKPSFRNLKRLGDQFSEPPICIPVRCYFWWIDLLQLFSCGTIVGAELTSSSTTADRRW
eukprot:1704057-Rhodomonas_salina.4